MARETRTARSARPGRVRLWLMRHVQTLLGSLGRMVAQPFSTLMTVAVIGIALALPASLYLLVQNGKALGGRWDSVLDVSVYLHQKVSATGAEALAQRLLERPDIGEIEVIPAAAALQEFRELSGFGPALDALEQNPLPSALLVRPAAGYEGTEDIERLIGALSELPEADIVQQDIQWVRRFHAILDIVRRAVALAAAMLAAAVVIIVGNTIRLDIQNRRDEIVVTKLVGGSDGFIRRPFLYSGLWYGLGGGTLALVLVVLSLQLLAGPVSQLAGLYGSEYRLEGLSSQAALALVIGGGFLGWFGSWIAAARHLRAIEPD